MKTLGFTFLFIFFINFNTLAQTQSDIIGKWIFNGFPESTGLSEEKKATGTRLFQDFTLDLNKSMQYEATIMGNKDTGNWALNGNTILLKHGESKPMFFTINSFTKDEMAIEYNSLKIIVKRISGSEIKPELSADSRIAASVDQLSKKWYLKLKAVNLDLSDKQAKAMNEMLNGSYLDLRPDKSYKQQAGPVTEEGEWLITDNNTAVITKGNQGSKRWHIIKITETDLVLVMGSSKEFWKFTSEN